MNRRRTAQEKKLADDARLMKCWRAWHAEQFEEALSGVHRDVLQRVMARLENLKSARELVNAMAAEDWAVVDANTRLIVLHQINNAICELRTRSGQEPFSDPLPDQPDNAFSDHQKAIRQFSAACGKARRGVPVNRKRLSKMSNELETAMPHPLDGFGGFTEAVVGGGQPPSGVSLNGLKLKYLDPIWTDPDELEVKGPLVVHDIQRKVQKWLDDTRPVETIVLTPGQPWPDIEKMNAECPKHEWREKFGKQQGPWQGEHVVLFFDDKTMVRYWWPSPITTVGSAICVRELVAQTKLMRSYKGEQIYPLVELSHSYMPTNYGGRERPNLLVKNWVRFGEGGSLVLPTPNKPVLTDSATASNPLEMQSVEKLTAKEVTGDEIKF